MQSPSNDTSDFETALRQAIDGKTKPVGALGQIETLAARIARVQGSLTPKAETATLTIFAADHGIASAGVSAYPQHVTRQMVVNFLAGGAAANVFARSIGAKVSVVDAGVAGEPFDEPGLVDRRMGPGTSNAIDGPAMTAAQCDAALSAGEEIGAAIPSDIACFGEMGIGNTSSASLLAAKRLGRAVSDLVGRGTGVDDDALARKTALLEQAASRTPTSLEPRMTLTEYGGFEIAMMAGAMIGAARTRRIVIVDGFIASVAALYAKDLVPGTEQSFVFAHKSAEAGHVSVLHALDAKPLLDLDMRLGEGTGALLAVPLVRAAAAMLREMASFESASVSGPA
ncbi:MAG: nicotinate-nucleotide--dimethylbenzimidazole phosphoribosyltransferase [Pseudomonadota bacterium]